MTGTENAGPAVALESPAGGHSRIRRVSLAAMAVVGAEIAAAYSYGWQGHLPTGHNTACDWYTNYGNCGPWRTDWNHINGTIKNLFTTSSFAHVGFENANAVRGAYIGGGGMAQYPQSATVTVASTFPSGGNLEPDSMTMMRGMFNSLSLWYRAYT
jgi:hypothetical protein